MKTKAMKHQQEGLDKSARKRNFAYLMEQGTGKTWLTLADFERLVEAGLVDAMLVVAPKGVHINWVTREIPTHLSIETWSYIWRGKPTTKKAKKELEDFMSPWPWSDRPQPVRVLVINIDAVITKDGYDLIEKFIKAERVYYVVDEATRIKNHGAARTKAVIKSGREAVARRILTGTPMPRSPFDLYSQFDFLKKGLLNCSNIVSFKAEYATLLARNDPEMIAIMEQSKARFMPQVVKKDDNGQPMYRNLNKLSNLIDPHSFRVKKIDCLDLPAKVYKTIPFELTTKQRGLYDTLAEEYMYDLKDEHGFLLETISFEAIAARAKMKQVTSGFINIYAEPQLLAPSDNPRMAAFKEYLRDVLENYPDKQFIVWAMYTQEIIQICEWLESEKIVAARYDGSTSQVDRDRIIDEFQAGKIQGFVGHAAAAGIGITLTAADLAMYYSCDFNNELRLQSEDRCHRIGTKNTVVYVDFVAEDTIDEDIVKNLRMKTRLSDIVIDKNN